jgi:2-methylisocitrate lyase-like PEP mutase family enzyme
MNNRLSIQQQKAEKLLAFHHNDQPLILPNIWNPLGANLLEDLGYPSIATSSSAIAMTNGLLDGENITFQSLLTQLGNIANAVTIPVTADVEKGYAENDEELESNIEALIDAGIVGINFEDGDKKSGGLVPVDIQCQRLQLIRRVANRKGVPLVLNARTDTYIHGNLFPSQESLIAETIKRGNAYRNAGADCFFPILIKEEKEIELIVKQVSLPVNIMQFPGIPTFENLIRLGVKRISLGSSFLKVAIQAMKQEAVLLKDFMGQKEIINNEITSGYLEKLVSKRN